MVFRPLLVLLHCGHAPQGLLVMGKGEAAAMNEKRGECGRKRTETMMSRRSLKKMTNRVVFVFE